MLNHLREHAVQRMFVKSLLDDLLCLKNDLARVAADIDAFKSLNGKCKIHVGLQQYQDVLRNAPGWRAESSRISRSFVVFTWFDFVRMQSEVIVG